MILYVIAALLLFAYHYVGERIADPLLQDRYYIAGAIFSILGLLFLIIYLNTL